MQKIKKYLEADEKLWNLFVKKNEYFIERPDRYSECDSQNKNFNVLQPEISKFLIKNGLKVQYPQKKKFAVCLTHDVDEIYPPFSHMLLSSLYCIKNLNFSELKNQLLWRNKGKENSPYLNFKEIIRLEEKYDSKSSFYFLTSDDDIKRYRYNIEDLKNELGYIVEKGWEVGLHGGYYTYDDLKKMKKEKNRLEKVLGKEVIGYRNHYLRFKVPDTWELQRKAGFKYDTTFGYNDMIGFRNGMCHPFKPFNLNTNQEINILEIPLIVMDGTLFSLSKSFKEAFETIKRLIDIIEQYNGVITLLWHSNNFNCVFRDSWIMFYEKILKYCYDKNAWMTSGECILRWWENG